MPAIESNKTKEELLQELGDLWHHVAVLELERDRLRTIADWCYDWEYSVSPDGGFLYCSPSCQRTTGWSAGDFLSNPHLIEEIVHPEDQSVFCEHRQHEHLKDGPYTLTFRIVRPDGEVRWIEHGCVPITAADGGFLGRRASNRDITEQRRAEQALQQALAQAEEGRQTLVALMESIPEGITIADAPSMMIRMVSRYSQEMHGRDYTNLPVDEVIAEWKVYQKDGVTPMATENLPLARAIRQGEVVTNSEIVQLNSQGKGMTLLCNAAPIRGANGTVTGGIVAWRDVTELKQAQEAVEQAKRSLEREKDILQAVMDGAKNSHLVYLDRDFNFLRVNEAYAKTCGYTPAEMIGKNHFALYPDAENEAIFARVRDTGIPVEFHDKPFIFPDQPNRGPTYWDWTLTPVKDATSMVVGLVFSLVDTTARKQVEANLQASKERFELAVRGSGVGIWDWDIRTGKVYYSPRWKRLFGYEENEIGDGFEDWVRLLHPDEGESIVKFQEDFLKGTSPSVTAEYRLRHKDGSYRWIEAHAVVVRDEEGKACRLVGSHGDITARKRAEEDLKSMNETLEQRVTERTEAIQMLHSIAAMANHVQDAGHAIEYCLHRLAMYNGWNFGHALLPAADNPDELVPRYICYPQDPDRFRRFREVTLGIQFRRDQDLPGRALASGQPEWTTDLQRDLVASRAVVAEELGLGTAIAFPILVGKKVAGILEFFSDRVIQPDRRSTETMLDVGLQLGRVLERASFEEHLLTIAEEIRQGMAQDLHDDVGQELTGLGLKTETLAEMLASTKSPAEMLAADIAVALDRTRGKVRKLSRGLLPVELEEGLLASALGQLAATATAGSPIACTFDCFHPDPVFNRRAAMHLYRIAQEAVSNAVRHSEARNIRITLDHQDGETALRIEDDGTGLPEEASQTEGMGLRTMQSRAGLIGGKLDVGAGSHGGTQVVCRLFPQNIV